MERTLLRSKTFFGNLQENFFYLVPYEIMQLKVVYCREAFQILVRETGLAFPLLSILSFYTN